MAINPGQSVVIDQRTDRPPEAVSEREMTLLYERARIEGVLRDAGMMTKGETLEHAVRNAVTIVLLYRETR